MALRNLDGLQQDLETQSSGGGYEKRKTWIKFPEGTHKIRIIPAGTHDKDRFYRKVTRHSLRSNNFKLILCWDHINENPLTVRDQLVADQKLDKNQWGLYKDYGCPACNAKKALEKAGVHKQTIQRCQTKTGYGMNIYYKENKARRKGGSTIEPGVYIWEPAWKWTKRVIDMVVTGQDAYEVDVLDPVTGFDVLLTVTGNGINKDYVPSLFPKPCPISDNPLDVNHHDLAKMECFSFTDYQSTINETKLVFLKHLVNIGFTFPGDTDPNHQTIDLGMIDSDRGDDVIRNTNRNELESEFDVQDAIGTKGNPVPKNNKGEDFF
jgi:hypothetical protein